MFSYQCSDPIRKSNDPHSVHSLNVYSTRLRFCPECAAKGFISRYHQNMLFDKCVFDGSPLVDTGRVPFKNIFPDDIEKDDVSPYGRSPVFEMLKCIPEINHEIKCRRLPFEEFRHVWFYSFRNGSDVNYGLVNKLISKEPYFEIRESDVNQFYMWLRRLIFTHQMKTQKHRILRVIERDLFYEKTKRASSEMAMLKIFCIALMFEGYSDDAVREVSKQMYMMDTGAEAVMVPEDELMRRALFASHFKFTPLLYDTVAYQYHKYLRYSDHKMRDTLIDRLIYEYVSEPYYSEAQSAKINLIISAMNITYALGLLYERFLKNPKTDLKPDVYAAVSVTQDNIIQLRMCADG